ncbi:MAG: hypothetical protein Q7S30_03285 [Candidatus Omnitrophota bacterium]|nr:hypothetical protein [Candidatus Omnitrophota bacterium]
MYKAIQSGNKGLFVLIGVVALTLVIASGDHLYGADFKSEDELIDETRANVEKHLNDDLQTSSPVVTEKSTAPEQKIVEEPTAVKAEPIPAKEEQAPVVENKPTTIETPIVKDKPATIETPAAAEEPPADDAPVAETYTAPAAAKKIETPSDVTTIDPESNSVTKSDKAAAGEDVEFVSGIKEPLTVKPLVEPVLKKMDVNKIGASPYYETYEGLRLLKYFTVAQRVEIYQEARPVDSYIMDAFAMRQIYPNTPWNIKSDYRTQLTPIFTRAYGTEITFSDPKNKEGQIRYTHDYREIYKNYFPKYQYSAVNPDNGETIDNFIKKEMWDQNEVLLMHSKQIEPIGWNYTSNLGYRYSTMSAKDGDPFNSYYQTRSTYFGSLSLAPNEKLEWFGQAEYFKSRYTKCAWAYSPDHFLGRTELRIKSSDMKTVFVPSFSYSKDYYYPFADTYQKYEIFFRVGRDFTKKFSASSTVKYVMGLRDTPDNRGPTYLVPNPFKDKAYTIALENRFSYNVYDRLYLQAGLDVSNGMNWSIFDNFAMLAGLEYYAPGMIRVDVGWNGNYYYNLQDFMSSVYFKFYLFM